MLVSCWEGILSSTIDYYGGGAQWRCRVFLHAPIVKTRDARSGAPRPQRHQKFRRGKEKTNRGSEEFQRLPVRECRENSSRRTRTRASKQSPKSATPSRRAPLIQRQHSRGKYKRFSQKINPFLSNTYHQGLLRGFDELRNDAHLCDVTLIAGNSKFPVHRTLLAACSPYFRSMFTKDAQSSTICRSEGSKYTWFSESIELRGISSEGLRHIVEFIYTGRIPISMSTVQNILAVSRHMQIQAVLDFCMEFLISAIDVNTCVDIIHIAEVFGMPQLEDKATSFMLDRFPDFMKSSQLQKLTFDNMAALLESNDLKAMSEMDVFAATLKWIMYDPARQQYIRKLMERIRFPLMPPRDLMVHVNVVDFMRTKCNDLLLEASSYHMLPHSQVI